MRRRIVSGTSRRVGPGLWATLCLAGWCHGQITGPSSSLPPFLVPIDPDVQTVALLTVGDSVNARPDGSAYRLAGIPDGLGALDNGDGTFTLLVNHEISSSLGIPRAHGGRGAFVSEWTIDVASLAVLHGEDLIRSVFVWSTSSGTWVPSPAENFSRFCSADLPGVSAFFDATSGLGTTERIFLNGEETGSNGRAFAHIVTGPNAGTSYQLARLGRLSFENAVPAPHSGTTTVVIGLEDATGGELYVYVGSKTASGNEIERAGLANGALYGLRVVGLPVEDVATGLGGVSSRRFELVGFGDVSAWSGSQLESQSVANQVTAFQRPEDGHWDPRNPNDFYWVTTGSSAPGRLWRLRFDDITQPTLGGTIELLLDGTQGIDHPDNVVVDRAGHVLIQEDRGSSALLARVWIYDILTGQLTRLARANPDFFRTSGSNFLTTNEESSGIIEARDLLGPGWFLLTMQAHVSANDAELVERGQLLAMFVPQAVTCTGDLDADGDIDASDLESLLSSFGGGPGGDLSGDGTTDLTDLSLLLSVFGSTCQ